MSSVAAISTPLSAGGLGVIRISGDDAIDIAYKVFKPFNKKDIREMKGYTAAYGSVIAQGEAFDDAVCLIFRAPKSYTGENVAEITCHGGLFVLQKALRAVLNAGASAAGPGEFTKRAFLNGKLDLTRAEAVMSLISAQGEQGAKAAKTALDGALSDKIREIQHSLVSLSANFAAWVDYPDEDIEELSSDSIEGVISEAENSLRGLLSRFDAGRAITQGVNTAIVGRPNVGKSTLMNMLTGYKRSIVTSVAGTTRDVVEETVRLGDVVLRLADTAGIRETDDEVESIGVNLAVDRIDRAELVLAVFDVSRETNSDDLRITEACKGKNAIAVLNKNDLPVLFDIDLIKPSFPVAVSVCADSGDGYSELCSAVEKVLGTDKIDTSCALLTTERQRNGALKALQCIEEASEALRNGLTLDAVNVSLDCAVEALGELTGEKATEMVVDEVFKSFCVGK